MGVTRTVSLVLIPILILVLLYIWLFLGSVVDHEAVSLLHMDGSYEVIEGPSRFSTFGVKEWKNLAKKTATMNDYLEVQNLDGTKTFPVGPTVMFVDPRYHKSIHVRALLVVKKEEAYSLEEHEGSLTIVQGPQIVNPEDKVYRKLVRKVANEDEYLHVTYLDGKEEFLSGPASVFVDKSVHRNVSVRGKRQVKEGERIAVYEEDGQITLLDGPICIIPRNRRIEDIRLFSASEKEYLQVRFLNGTRRNLNGPVSMFKNPNTIQSITVGDAHKVTGGEVLIVYSLLEDAECEEEDVELCVERDPSVARRKIVSGPTLYVPKSDEWYHEFSWTGSSRKLGLTKERGEKVKGALKFTNLRTTPDQFYVNVHSVRTSDDALLTCKLMIFYELSDLELMLQNTIDPIGDMVNSLTADVISFSNRYVYDDFIEHTPELNKLETYEQLITNTERIGFRIRKIVYRGYESSKLLEDMHIQHIEKRTKLRLEYETEEKRQELEDFKLTKEMERSKMKMSFEKEKQEHQNELEQKKHDERMRQLGKERLFEESKTTTTNDELVRKLTLLKDLEVDVNNLMLEEAKVSPEKLIEIRHYGENPEQQLKLNV